MICRNDDRQTVFRLCDSVHDILHCLVDEIVDHSNDTDISSPWNVFRGVVEN